MTVFASSLDQRPEAAAEGGETADPKRSLGDFRKQIAWLRTQVDPESNRFAAAALLLASSVVEQNVDKLARFTGYPREFVARCARRLVDNGVWRSGALVTSWDDPAADPKDFWRDVQVAEGLLCRRQDSGERPEWAAPGEWWKSYEFVQQQSEGEVGATYAVRQQWSPEPESAGFAADEPGEPGEATDVDSEDRAEPPARSTGSGKALSLGLKDFLPGSMPSSNGDIRRRSVPVVNGAVGASELFTDAVWLT